MQHTHKQVDRSTHFLAPSHPPPGRSVRPALSHGVSSVISPSRVCRDSAARVFRIPTDGSGKSHIYQSRSHSVIRPRDFAVPRVGTAGRYFGLSRVCRDSVARVLRIPIDGSGKSHIYQSGSYSVPCGLAVPRGGTKGTLSHCVR